LWALFLMVDFSGLLKTATGTGRHAVGIAITACSGAGATVQFQRISPFPIA
jgi:hypothetical protein